MGGPSPDIPILVIFGPTASGKTALAEQLFAAGGSSSLAGKTEIISADSMQVYTGLNIGTAKPEQALLSALPHHLINVYPPHRQFSAGDFVRLADRAVQDIAGQGKIPVIMGGTAFYIRNFLYGLPATPDSDEAVRQNLRLRMDREGPEKLWAFLNGLDPVSAGRIHINDEYRILRALEVYTASNRPLSSFRMPDTLRKGYRFYLMGIELPREELYGRINRRVTGRFEQGLVEEFFGLLDSGYTAEDPGMQAIGYREFFMVDPEPRRETIDTEAVGDMIRRDTRRYAKRQFTFFRGIPGVRWINAEDTRSARDHAELFYSGNF
ncbi:MAG: tRNA (adenosine(37)-N6)-dimethylallyltransferase MiaA [Spirochaetaceae bacterium]|jgi:tRNA dimethylallyltransferase|nr:tRNA (adenosine(37)-N6)-dimethylallyltransferase MiaA [Spirochaetaceae bacterium]